MRQSAVHKIIAQQRQSSLELREFFFVHHRLTSKEEEGFSGMGNYAAPRCARANHSQRREPGLICQESSGDPSQARYGEQQHGEISFHSRPSSPYSLRRSKSTAREGGLGTGAL